MPFDEIDDALRRQPMWEPPAAFSRQVAAAAVRLPVQSHTVTAAWSWTTAWHAAASLAASCQAALSGYAWMVRQYWALLAR